jgi:hypothetical protein
MIGCVFSLASAQILPSNLAGGNVYSVENALGEDIKVTLSYNGTTCQVLTYVDNEIERPRCAEHIQPSLIYPDPYVEYGTSSGAPPIRRDDAALRVFHLQHFPHC